MRNYAQFISIDTLIAHTYITTNIHAHFIRKRKEKKAMNKKPAFKATRLTSTVFQLTEYSDIYSEHPFIYLKLLPEVVVLIDSGCGGKSTDPEVNLTSLREFIETVPIEDNDGKPFNEDGPEKREYIVICTHCHYDHIRE